jgi:hypothetical protein
MPSITKLALIARVVTLPETRNLILAASRSETVRDVARRARSDRAGLVRDLGGLRDPAVARDLIRSAAAHPATKEMAGLGLIFLPGRYGPLGWAAVWTGKRAWQRILEPPVEVVRRPPLWPRPQKDVTPR